MITMDVGYSRTSKKDWRTFSSSQASTAGTLSKREQLRLDKQLSREADIIKRMKWAWEHFVDYGEEPGFVMTKHDYIILGELVARLTVDGSVDSGLLVTELSSFINSRDGEFDGQKFRESCQHKLIRCCKCGEELPSTAFSSERLRHKEIICRRCTR